MFSLLTLYNLVAITSFISGVYEGLSHDRSNEVDIIILPSEAEIERASSLANNKFPDDFYFGVASSAYECEGAWNVDDKGESVWDYMTHSNPALISGYSNGDVSSDFYHKYLEDIQLASAMGLTMMRISLSWSRILPDGYTNRVSSSGVAFYDNVITEMLANNITPMVSLFDNDMPYRLQQLGGWANPVIIDIFVDYANFVFTLFGDKVKYWATVNDAAKMCRYGYGGTYIPSINLSGVADYLCGHHVLLAHAKVYKLYHQTYDGKLGILNYYTWFEPAQNYLNADNIAAELAHIFYNDWLTQPIFGRSGDYPQIMKMSIGLNSYVQNFSQSRLPTFSFSDVTYVQGSADFLGINYYTAVSVKNNANVTENISFDKDADIRIIKNTNWFGEMDIKNTPWGLTNLLHRLHDSYLLPEIWITGNGYANSGDNLDFDRASYHHDHLNAVLKAMQNGIDIKGYLVKSLTDGFEGMNGYEMKFGLVSVDFNDPNRTRTLKSSAAVIYDISTTKQIKPLKEIFDAFVEKLNLLL
ncbi:myrosinase 1-like [Odontomachus brunneus]|uniref:myrosinase 1-like n=1 Tax=Odontomachus brunneus TaxID=486640 RepID=UPI0013F1963B|nr:myrosinase 1-like [Odontomachus brunneus]